MKPEERLGQRLKAARLDRKLSQDAVANILEIPRTAVVKIESGARLVSSRELSKLAELYNRQESSFFSNAKEIEDPLQALYRSSHHFEELPEDRDCIKEIANICKVGAFLANELGVSRTISVPIYKPQAPKNVREASEQGTEVAEEERRRLGLGNQPIADVSRILSDQLIWAASADLPNEVSGVFLNHAEFGIAIIVQECDVRERRRFSYAHEYAHALLDRDLSWTVSSRDNRSDLSEVRANSFAAAFLMPEEGLRHFLDLFNKGGSSRREQQVYDPLVDELGVSAMIRERSVAAHRRLSFEHIARIAFQFGVSYQAAAYRLRNLDYFNSKELDSFLSVSSEGAKLVSYFGSESEKLNQDDNRSSKIPRSLGNEILFLVFEAYRKEKISYGRFCEIINMIESDPDSILKLIKREL